MANASPSKRKQPSSSVNWLGGTGNWSDAGLWTPGLPGSSSDVVIYSGASDSVSLDVSASINSLTIGGTTGSALLMGVGTPTLTIAQSLTVNQTGSFELLYNQTATAASLSNAGTVYVGLNAALNLTSQPNGITDILQDSLFYILGSFTTGNQGAFENLTSVEGRLILGDLQTASTTPVGGTFTIASTGSVLVDNALLHVTGDLTNFGSLEAQSGNGAHRIEVSGVLTNANGATLNIAGDSVSLGSLANQGFVINWGTINLTHQPGGITDIVAGSEFRNYGTVSAGANDAFGHLQSVDGRLLIENGKINNVTPGSGKLNVASSGYLELDWIFRPGTTLQVNGNLDNAGWIKSNGGSLIVTETLNNTNRLDFFGNGLPDQNRLVVMDKLVNSGRIIVDNDPTVTTPFLLNSGRIDIDKQSGLMVGTGAAGLGYVQYADGILGEVISGTNRNGTIWLGGGAALDGTLSVMLENGYIPQIGEIFRFMYFKPGSLSGQFAQIDNQYFNNGTEEWVVNYDNAGGYLELQVVSAAPTPEPGTLALLGSSVVGLGMLLRRRLHL